MHAMHLAHVFSTNGPDLEPYFEDEPMHVSRILVRVVFLA